jgi:hypothetical protein
MGRAPGVGQLTARHADPAVLSLFLRARSSTRRNARTFALYIDGGYFSIIALNFADTTSLDHSLATDIRQNPRYRKIQVAPYGIEIPLIGQGTYVTREYGYYYRSSDTFASVFGQTITPGMRTDP